MLRLLNARPATALDKLANPDHARRWLDEIDALEPHAACGIPMRWEKTHRVYRQAMQQLLHDVRAEFSLPAILEAMQPSVAAPKAHYEEIELRAVGDDIAGSTAWAVYDVSLSGCRLRGKLRPGLAVVPGTCQSRPHNYRLALQECVGQTDDYVWSTVHASKSPRAAQS